MELNESVRMGQRRLGLDKRKPLKPCKLERGIGGGQRSLEHLWTQSGIYPGVRFCSDTEEGETRGI